MKLTTTSKTILLALAFQVVWLSLISTAKSDYYWLGPVVGLIAYILILPGLIRSKIALPLITISFLGFAYDVTLHQMGIIELHHNGLALTWLLILWLVFIGVFYRLFSWLTNLNTVSSFITGSFGGLAAYIVASLFGAMTINSLGFFLLLYGLFWGGGFSLASRIFIARNLTANRRSSA